MDRFDLNFLTRCSRNQTGAAELVAPAVNFCRRWVEAHPKSTGGKTAALPRPQQPSVNAVRFRVGLSPVFQIVGHPPAGAGRIAYARE